MRIGDTFLYYMGYAGKAFSMAVLMDVEGIGVRRVHIHTLRS